MTKTNFARIMGDERSEEAWQTLHKELLLLRRDAADWCEWTKRIVGSQQGCDLANQAMGRLDWILDLMEAS